jgi:hypothetical protein
MTISPDSQLVTTHATDRGSLPILSPRRHPTMSVAAVTIVTDHPTYNHLSAAKSK